MDTASDEILDATTALLPVLMSSLEALAWVGRHLHPPDLPTLAQALIDFDDRLSSARTRFAAVGWPESLADFRDRVLTATDAAQRAVAGVIGSADDPNGVLGAYRAMRQATRAVETLYPLALALPPVSRFFVDPEQRADETLAARLAGADAARDDVGVLHAANGRDQRGGVSIYVPEYYDPDQRWPLVVALHGGSGHGADFLWTWLREARTWGCIVLAPTSVGDTWSLMQPEIDVSQLSQRVARTCEHWSIDRAHVLLTGMSDGGTMSLLTGLVESGPYTHLAPISGSFHPLVMTGARDIRELPIYLVHGALDWMFPVDMARDACETLSAAGAAVTYREIDDLSHTYPREENRLILDWFLTR